MRRANKEIKDSNVIREILEQCKVGRLGTTGKDGYPMVKPLNFVFHEKKIYFHTAKEGEKIEDLGRDNRVCFEVDLPVAFLRARDQPCEAEYLYRSVIIKGRATIMEAAEEKVSALKLLMEKYQPEKKFREFPEAKLDINGVVRIDIEEMTGKEDLGKDSVRDAALVLLRGRTNLPVELERE